MPDEPIYDLIGIGNAMVDVLAQVDDRFLDKQAMRKGSMGLINNVDAARLYAAMPPGREASGGSVANSCAVAAGLGARAAFLGKVADDPLGRVFRGDMAAMGVYFPTPFHENRKLKNEEPTARCLVLVTPDGQRTMQTHLGIAGAFTEADLDEAAIAASAVLYLEGYLFDPEPAQAAFRRAARLARKSNRLVALSLSDAFCVDRHRDGFLQLIRDTVDIIFANETEICSLFKQNEFQAALRQAAETIPLAVLTRGAAGSMIVQGACVTHIDVVPADVVDTTGAGDAYAAGFLAAYTKGKKLAECGALASKTAALAITRIGARPDAAALRALVT
jgi:sugar/nucleoside kinase (ribokinase family)